MKNNFNIPETKKDKKIDKFFEDIEYYKKLKSTILNKIESKLGKKEGSIWFVKELDLYTENLQQKYPEYSDRQKYVAWHVLYGSSLDETTVKDICFCDFKEDDCSVKNFFKMISKKIDNIL